MNDTALGKVFQEISDDFANMAPTSLDELEDGVLTAMYVNDIIKVADYRGRKSPLMARMDFYREL